MEDDTVRRSNREMHDLVVWRVALRTSEAESAARETLLSPEDMERARSIRAPSGRTRFTVARAALRSILSRYTGWPAPAIPIQLGPNGKPGLAPQCSGPAFSVTHTAGLILIATCSAGMVGIDAERMRDVPRIDRITNRLFAHSIARRLGSLPDEERRIAFFHAWTQREAYVKAIGGTMYRTLDPLPLVWPPDPGPQRVRVSGAPHQSMWTLYTMRPSAGFIASVVAAGSVGSLRVLEYPDDLDLIDQPAGDGPAA